MTIVANTSLFRVKLFATFLGQEVLNRFWYQAGPVPDTIDAADVLTAFEAKVGATWSAAVSTGWVPQTVEVDEVTSDENFTEAAATIAAGAVLGETLGPNVAMAIRLFRATKVTRSGWKRVAGVVEPNQSDGVITGAQVALNAALGDKFTDTLTVDVNALYPVIVRQTYSGEPPVLNPASQWIYNLIADYAAQTNLTTQNTRKYTN